MKELAFKMKPVTEVHLKLRAVTEFLLAENESISHNKHLQISIYGYKTVDKSTASCWENQHSSSEEGKGK